MQLQNRDIKVKYSIILDQDEMNAVIHGLKCGLAHLHSLRYDQVKEAIVSLEAFRGWENEPAEQELQPRTIITRAKGLPPIE